MSKNITKETIANYIIEKEDALAFALINSLESSEAECSENECDNCPIVKALIARDIQPEFPGQYPTCSDYVTHVFYNVFYKDTTRASEASVMERSDIGEGTYVTEPNKI